MKKLKLNLFLSALLLFVFTTLKSQNILNFKISKPYCYLNFIETYLGRLGTSSSLQDFIKENAPKKDTTFLQLLETFQSIQLDYSFNRAQFPQTRRANRSTYDLIYIAAVQANTIDEFGGRIVGILPNGEHQKLLTVLKSIEPYYEKMIWEKYGEQMLKQMNALESYQKQANEAFLKLKNLYNADWSNDMPFTVALYPIPGKKGNTSATPHANSLCVAVLTEETDYAGRMSVVMHEINHVLYDEQSPLFQHTLEKYFTQNTSPFAASAYNFFDEGMATACGNGWAFKYLTNKMDTTEWYNNEYINGFGKALFPLVEKYIAKGQKIDSLFVNEAIRLFGEKFPNAPNDFGIRMNNFALYLDIEDHDEAGRQIRQQAFFKHFSIYSLNSSSPILDKITLDAMKNSPQTQVIVVEIDPRKTINRLKTVFPELGKMQYDVKSNFVLNFMDKKNRLITIINIKKDGLDAAIKSIKDKRYFDPQKSYWVY
jgi:hypothetical protein